MRVTYQTFSEMLHGLFALPITALKTSPGEAIFGRDMLFDVPFLAHWSKIGEYRQQQMDKNTVKENSGSVDWDYRPSNTTFD